MKKLWYLFPATAWTITIIIASLVSQRNFRGLRLDNILGIDKLVHLTIYAILSFLLSWGFNKYIGIKSIPKKHIFLFFILASSLGLLMEIFQKVFTTTRGFDYYDIIANIIGAFIGSIIFCSYISSCTFLIRLNKKI